MSRLALDLARALDPVALAAGVGMVPDPLAIRGPGQRSSVDPAQLLPAFREIHNVPGEGRTF